MARSEDEGCADIESAIAEAEAEPRLGDEGLRHHAGRSKQSAKRK